MSRDDLIAKAKERAETPPVPEEWGFRIVLNEGDSFVGRWRGKTQDPDNVDADGNQKAPRDAPQEEAPSLRP
jgi:hypothetical protein